MSKYHSIPVVEYMISDSDEGIHHADNRNSFEQTDELMQKLRADNPDVEYTMFAEIDA